MSSSSDQDHRRVSRVVTLGAEQFAEWIALGVERLWRVVSGRTRALVVPRGVWVEAIHVTSERRMVPVTVHIKMGSADDHHLEVSTSRTPERARSPGLLPPTDRLTTRRTSVGDIGFGREPRETNDVYIDDVLNRAADEFARAASDVAEGRRTDHFVGIAVRVLDRNWPTGALPIGPYRLAELVAGQDFDYPTLTLTRTVTAFSRKMCEVHWSQRLHRAATLIGILADVGFEVTAPPPRELREKFGIAFHPFVEKPDTALAAFIESLPTVPTYDPYRLPPGLERVTSVPLDIDVLFLAYEALPDERREVLDDGLSAFQVFLEVRQKLPTAGLMALWTALERLSSLDARFTRAYRERSSGAKKNTSKSQAAILALCETLIADCDIEAIAACLVQVRKIRNNWAHAAVLSGLDLSTGPEIWVTDGNVAPVWTQIESLSQMTSDLFRRLVIALLRASTAAARQGAQKQEGS